MKETNKSSGKWIQKHADFSPARKSQLGFEHRSLSILERTMPAQPSNGFTIHLPSPNEEIVYGFRLRSLLWGQALSCYYDLDFISSLEYFFIIRLDPDGFITRFPSLNKKIVLEKGFD